MTSMGNSSRNKSLQTLDLPHTAKHKGLKIAYVWQDVHFIFETTYGMN